MIVKKDEKRCIFCGLSGKMTREHFWGDWTKAYVKRPFNKHTAAEVSVPRPGEPQPARTRTRAGHPLDANAPVVCAKCNSGWLSGIQGRAKPFLIPLFDGKDSLLSADAQSAIATWITMACMTAEHSNELKNIGIRQSERDWLMNHQTPPSGWRIWVGRCNPPSQMQWIHAAFRILDVDVLPAVISERDRIPNAQTTAFSIGQLYFFAMSAAGPEIAGGWDWRTARRATNRLQQIWPQKSVRIFWPPPLLTEEDVKSFGTAFVRYMEELALKAGCAE
jgi:hypothetical protein